MVHDHLNGEDLIVVFVLVGHGLGLGLRLLSAVIMRKARNKEIRPAPCTGAAVWAAERREVSSQRASQRSPADGDGEIRARRKETLTPHTLERKNGEQERHQARGHGGQSGNVQRPFLCGSGDRTSCRVLLA